MDILANAATLALAQERLHELGVPRLSGSEEADGEWEEAVEEFKKLEEEIDSQLETKKPKHFRVSNNIQSSNTYYGFSKKFVEHSCYSVDVWRTDSSGLNRMQQHQCVEVGDILWLSESRKNNRVYRGVVKTPFRKSGSENPSFYSRDDVLEIVNMKSYPDTEHPHYQDVNPIKRKAWLDKRCEYICQVEWSGPVEMNKSVLNEGFIGKTIASRNEKQGIALDREFFKNESENIEGVVSVTLGDLSGTRVNRPEGSKLHRNVLVNSTKKGTGWYVYMEEGKWYHLGGDKRGPILYFLEFRKGKGGSRGKEGWHWTKCKDQTKAHALYLDMGFDKAL